MSQNPFVPGQSPVPQAPTVASLLRQADELPYGREERAVLQEALLLAQRQGDEQGEYHVRLRLVASAQMAGDVEDVLSNFTWCVQHNEQDPARFPTQTEQCDLLWYYKWIPSLLAGDPAYSRDDVLAALGAMEQRYRHEGVGVSGVLHARFAEAFLSGHADEAERWRAELAITSRDEYSHCEACTRAEQVDFLLDRGEGEQALKYFDEIMDQALTCGEEPETVMSTVLLALLRAGRSEDAEQAHRLGYRMARDNPELVAVIARHVQFCAVTGNPARALTLLARHLPWLAREELPRSVRFDTLVPLAVACDVIAAAGHGDLPIRGSDDPGLVPVMGAHDGVLTVEEFGYAAWVAARRIARDFDARNGTARYRERLDDARVRVLERFPQIEIVGSAPVRLDRAEVPAADDVEGWIDEATWALTSGEGVRAEAAVELGLGAAPTPRQRLTLWGLRAAAAEGQERAAAVEERALAFEELGLAEEAAFEREHGQLLSGALDQQGAALIRTLLPQARSEELRGRLHAELGLHHLGAGEPQAAMREFLEATELADRSGDHETFLRALVGAAWAVPLEEEDGALQTRLLDMAQAAGPRANQAYDIAYLRAVEAVALRQDHEEALRLAARAADLAIAHRASGPLHQITRFRVDLLSEADRHEEAAAALHVLNEVLEDLGHPGDVVALAWEARELVESDRVAEAFEVASDARHDLGEREDGSPGQWALVDRWFAAAADACGFHGTAVESWDRSLTMGEQAWAEAPELADAQRAAMEGCQSGRSIVDLAARAGQTEDVHTYAERVLTLAREIDQLEPGLLAVCLEQLGRALAGVGDEAGVALIREAEASDRAGADPWFAADCHDAQGRALLDLGRAEEAVPVLLEAADAYTAAGDVVNAALAEYAVAHTLQVTGRGEDAVALYDGALERVKDMPGDVRSVIAGAYADLLVELGRPLEAVRIRRHVDGD